MNCHLKMHESDKGMIKKSFVKACLFGVSWIIFTMSIHTLGITRQLMLTSLFDMYFHG